MKIFSFFKKLAGITEYGRQIGHTSKNGHRVFCKTTEYQKILTGVDKNNKVIKIVKLDKNHNYISEKLLTSNGRKENYLSVRCEHSNQGRVIEKDVTIRTRVLSPEGRTLCVETTDWISQSKTVINKNNDAFTVLTTAEKPSGEAGELAQRLTYPRQPLASSAWWQWLFNGKPVSQGEFIGLKTGDISRLI